MGIEPTLSAWEAEVLPLNYTRDIILLRFPSLVMGLFRTSLYSTPSGPASLRSTVQNHSR